MRIHAALAGTLGTALILFGTGCSGHVAPRPEAAPSTVLPEAAGITVTAAALPDAVGTTATADVPREYVLLGGGDVLPGCWLEPYQNCHGFHYPYQALSPLFLEADAVVVNLECPLSRRGRRFPGKRFTFRSDPRAASAMRKAGITAVSLANNHILDFGPEALQDTLDHLAAAGIAHAGAGAELAASRRPAELVLGPGLHLALLSYSLTYPVEFWSTPDRPGTAYGEAAWIEADVVSACAWADAVVVCFHWGGELRTEPRAYQVRLGRAAIDAGASLVLGSHPHVLQGVEWYGDGAIFYSLGNLVFGGGRSRRAVRSALARAVFSTGGTLRRVAVLPLTVDNLATEFIPAPLQGEDAAAVIAELTELSAPWGTRFTPAASGWWEAKPAAESMDSTPLP